jgi:DNA-directed RNA polymerase I subunit RPA2
VLAHARVSGCGASSTVVVTASSDVAATMHALLAQLRGVDGGEWLCCRSTVVSSEAHFLFDGAVALFVAPMLVGAVGFDPRCDAAVQRYDHGDAYRRARAGDANECIDVTVLTDADRAALYRRRRWLHYSWLPLLSRDQARAMLRGLAVSSIDRVNADSDDVSVQCDSLPLANDVTMLAVLAEGRPAVFSDETSWTVTVAYDDEQRTTALPRPVEVSNPAHNGRVYCVTVANGNFLARRRAHWGCKRGTAVGEASLMPFFNGNCQMGKQTMGTPLHAFPHRADNKVRLRA